MWVTPLGARFPPQALLQPTFYPYTATAGLLDAKGTRRGSRGGPHLQAPGCLRPRCGLGTCLGAPRPAHAAAKVGAPPPCRRLSGTTGRPATRPRGRPQADLAQAARDITVPGGGFDRFRESKQLQAQRRAVHRLPQGGQAARTAWKAVSRARKQEQRAWQQANIDRASWRAKRSLDHHSSRQGWEHRLLDDVHWQKHLTQHFRSIFHKVPQSHTAAKLHVLREALTRACKHAPWQPFTEGELQLATATWVWGKSTGPDGVALEALQAMLQYPRWAGRLQFLLNDFLFRGGVTVLLPKTVGVPDNWGDTRPITLSSAVLKWFGQLLLLRGGRQLQEGDTYQWARRGRQGTELLVVLRRVMRMSRDWGVPVWLIRLDIRKAFGVHGTSRGELLSSGGTAMGGSPWEARAWLGLLEARELRVAIGDTITSIPQSNGVRQGSPDSPCCHHCHSAGRGPHAHSRTPTTSGSGGVFMDDTYLWSHDHDHLQRTLTELEVRLAKDGLSIHPGKTAILRASQKGEDLFE
ncbi:unnamed protein product [Symbiodinium sp. CCMP2592]|nr:unnamed protein product [Symbiodinium sp. CCMP2592]